MPYTEENNKVANYITKREKNVLVLSGNATIFEENNDNLNLTCKLTEVTDGTILELPCINYPGYKITLKNDNYEQNIEYTQSENGLIQIQIPDDFSDGELQVQYTGTVLEKISYIISVSSIILFVIYLIYTKRKDKLNDTKP